MTLERFRALMTVTWHQIERDAEDSRDPNLAEFAFGNWYGDLAGSERRLADQVLAEWVHSQDDGQQFDALAVIGRYGIDSARPAVEELHATFGVTTEPEARFLRAKVERLLDLLRTPDALQRESGAGHTDAPGQ